MYKGPRPRAFSPEQVIEKVARDISIVSHDYRGFPRIGPGIENQEDGERRDEHDELLGL